MRACLVVLLVFAACGYPQLPDVSVEDASTNAPPDAHSTQYGTFIKIKFSSVSDVPTTPLTLPSELDTGTSTLCNIHRSDQAASFCVIAGTSITLPSGMTLNAHGSKPLVLLATTTFDLEGVIDASSKRGAQTGAGARTTCPGATAATGHSGGFGGSFGGSGGTGGTPMMTTGETGGAPGGLLPAPTTLTGGCPGGDGVTDAGAGGAGGAGGGAVAIIAPAAEAGNDTAQSGGAGGIGSYSSNKPDGALGLNGAGSGGGGAGGGGAGFIHSPKVAGGVFAPAPVSL